MNDEITIEQLKKSEFLVDAKKKLDEFLNYNSAKDAWLFVLDFEQAIKQDPGFETSYRDLSDQYKDILVKMKLIALPFLKDEEIVDVLKDHFSIMLLSFPPVTNDIVDKLTQHLVGIPIYEERDMLKGKIRKILFESQEKITTNNLKDEKGIEQPPTINNWIKNYLNAVEGAEEDLLKLNMYLYNVRTKMGLSEKEEEAIKMLISLYEFLGKSSLTMEGMEESILVSEDGVLKILDHGNLEIIGPAAE